MSKKKSRSKKRQHQSAEQRILGLPAIEPDVAFVDIASEEHWVCIPEHRCEPGENVRRFESYTCDLHGILNWLKENNIRMVAMESTGVYWIHLYMMLEEAGFKVGVVDARQLKRVPGRPKTDRLDCQWGQRLLSCGLLSFCFRPIQVICQARSIWRMRDQCVRDASRCVQRMQKALHEMNLKLSQVVSDITGKTGLEIIDAILAGERDPHALAALKDPRIKRSKETIAKALEGDYREDQLFLLAKMLKQYRFLIGELQDYDNQISKQLENAPRKITLDEKTRSKDAKAVKIKSRKSGTATSVNSVSLVKELCGVDISEIPGLGPNLAMALVVETGTDMSKWPTEKHFSSWLGLCTNLKRSAGKDMSTRTKKCSSPAARHFRQAASSLNRFDGYLGDFHRRMKARKGASEANTATARKLAVIYYNMIKNGTEYQEPDMEQYHQDLKERRLKYLKKQAEKLGMSLVCKDQAA